MKIAITIETVKRPNGANYLDQTLANLTRAGVDKHPALAALACVDGTGFTRQQNGQRAISAGAALARLGGADWVLKLEDDLDFTDDFLGNVTRWLEDYGHANTCMFSLAATFETVSHSRFYNSESNIFQDRASELRLEDTALPPMSSSFPRVREYMRRGEACVPHSVAGYWGAQAILMRTADAQDLADFLGPDPALFDGKEYHRGRGHDLMLQQWGQKRNVRSFAVAVPSFVQHIGLQSNLDQPEINHKQPFFQFPFAGYDYRYQRRTR